MGWVFKLFGLNKHNDNNPLEILNTNIKLNYIEYTTNQSNLNSMKNFIKSFDYEIIHTVFVKRYKSAMIGKYNNQKYFIKILDNNFYVDNENIVYDILKNKKHEYLLNYVNKHEKYSYRAYVYDFLDGYSLDEYVLTVKNNMISEKFILNIIKQILNGLKELHSMNIIHGDIKLQNIYVIADEKIKIIDYDLSKLATGNDLYIQCSSVFGTKNYISPESYHLSIYSSESDIWSTGVILFYLICFKFPFDEVPDFYDVTNVYRRNIFKHPNMHLIEQAIIEKNYNENLLRLTQGLIEFNIDQRFTIDQSIEMINKIEKQIHKN